MRDPFPIPPPEWLIRFVKPYSDALSLHSLPLHAHEVIFAILLYAFICNVVSPFLSNLICPGTYPRLSPRTRLNWDVHVVSFFQSVLISALSFWIMFGDEERAAWKGKDNWHLRIWAYDGAGGMCQSFALGYFMWDLYMCAAHMDVFGVGMLAHAVSAVAVFSFGYRPFVYFSAPIFLLYELSSPFLNIHWFCDKLNLTGSIYQAVNGGFLTLTFFSCRIVWGLYSSFLVFYDIYRALASGASNPTQRSPPSVATPTVQHLLSIYGDTKGQVTAFNADRYLPLWLPVLYLASNVVLNTLNIFWFGKMIDTIRARFEPPLGTKGTAAAHKLAAEAAAEAAADAELDAAVPGAAVDGVDGKPLKTDEGGEEPERVLKKEVKQVTVAADGSVTETVATTVYDKKEGSVKAARLRAEQALEQAPGDGAVSSPAHAAASAAAAAATSGTPGKSVRNRRRG